MRNTMVKLTLITLLVVLDPSSGLLPLPDPSIFYPLIPNFLRLQPKRPRAPISRPSSPKYPPSLKYTAPSNPPPPTYAPTTYHPPAPTPAPTYAPPAPKYPPPTSPPTSPPTQAPYAPPAPSMYAPAPSMYAPAPPPPPPAYQPPKSTNYHHEEPTAPAKYSYKYDVSDHYAGPKYEHSETRDGHKTAGSYTVDLPDGRKQTVTYVDNGHGLMVDVKVEGMIKQAPAPSYEPALSDKPAPPQSMYS